MKENGQCAKTESVKAMGRLPYDNAGIDDAEPSGYDRSMKTALAKGQKNKSRFKDLYVLNFRCWVILHDPYDKRISPKVELFKYYF